MNNKFKSQYRNHHNSVWILMFLTGLMLFGLYQTLPAQIIRTNPQVRTTPTPQVKRTPPSAKDVIVFKGEGVKKTRPDIKQVNATPPPEPLTEAEKQALFNEVLRLNGVPKSALAIPYAVLSARSTYVENRAWIATSNSRIEGLANMVDFDGRDSYSWITVYIKPTKKGDWLMVSCSFYSPKKRNFKIEAPDGSVASKDITGADHIQVLFLAKDNNWHRISFETVAGPEWLFYSCEITKK
jgi:hypothetical protein